MLDDVGDAVLDGVGSILFDPECSLLGGNIVFRAISFDSCSWRTIYDGHCSFVWLCVYCIVEGFSLCVGVILKKTSYKV
jgi:hypothetical protein